MKLLDKYLFSLIFKSSILTLLGLVALFSFFQFLEELDDIGTKYYTLNVAIKFVLFKIPSYFNMLSILGIMIGVVFILGQLNSNRELQIYHVASISRKAIIIKSLKFSSLISLFLIIILETISPFSLTIADKFKKEALRQPVISELGDIWLKKNNNFFNITKNADSYDLKVFEVEEGTLLKSFLYKENVEISNEFLTAKNSSKIEIKESNGLFKVVDNSQVGEFRFEFESDQQQLMKKNLKLLSISEILSSIKFSIDNQINFEEIFLELVSRLIKPLTLVGMILIATPFVLNFKRSTSVGNRIFIAIAIGVLTHLLTKISSVLSVAYENLTFFGPFIPTIFLILLGLAILKIKL